MTLDEYMNLPEGQPSDYRVVSLPLEEQIIWYSNAAHIGANMTLVQEAWRYLELRRIANRRTRKTAQS